MATTTINMVMNEAGVCEKTSVWNTTRHVASKVVQGAGVGCFKASIWLEPAKGSERTKIMKSMLSQLADFCDKQAKKQGK